MTVRRNPITGDAVLFAPERAGRPHAFEESDEPSVEERCPFCPGNESDTPAEILRRGDPWRIRVFPNKYPAADGAEVIVESQRHEARFADLEDAGELVRVWRDRLLAHHGARHTALFRNEGRRAGASILHLHSQLVPLPFVPPRIELEQRGFLGAARCPLCAPDASAVITETSRFRWIAPHASRMPYQQWIVPKRHVSSMTALDDLELEELGALLQSSARATGRVADAWNWAFMNFESGPAHCYVDVMPRLTTVAGLELGAGTFVAIVDPETAARRLCD
jgi:UDPglucose--hexose-1-phosphate uridylyltransferase